MQGVIFAQLLPRPFKQNINVVLIHGACVYTYTAPRLSASLSYAASYGTACCMPTRGGDELQSALAYLARASR